MAAGAGPGHDRSMAGKSTAPPNVENAEEPGDPLPESPSPGANRFFTWMRSIDLPRQPGWIGGVCAGIAARLGIDPILVRGIVVVVAVLGGPALLLYAAAWLLLPDHKGTIHLEELSKGRLESPIAGIGAMVLLSLLPVTQGFWYAGATFWGEPSWGESVGRAVWTVIVLGLIVALVVWIARRANREHNDPLVTPATTDDRPDTIPLLPDGAAMTLPTLTVPTLTVPAPTAPAPGAPPEEVAAWREQQAAWKAEREAFRAQAAATAGEAARLRAEEARQRAAIAAAERAERMRRWRIANPNAGPAYSAIALGTAAIAGVVGSVIAPSSAALVVGLAVGAIVLGVAIVLAGLLRRRAGFLSFVSVVLLVASIGTAAVPSDRTFLPLGSSYGISNAIPGKYVMLWGNLTVTVSPSSPLDGEIIDVWQGAGSTDVYLQEGVTARLEIVSRDGEIWLSDDDQYPYEPLPRKRLANGYWSGEATLGADTEPDVTIRIWQGPGTIYIHNDTEPENTTETETTP